MIISLCFLLCPVDYVHVLLVPSERMVWIVILWLCDIWQIRAFWQKAEESVAQRPRSFDTWNERIHGSYEAHQSVPSIGNQGDRLKSTGNTSVAVPPGPLVLHLDLKPNSDAAIQSPAESHSESGKINGTLKVFPGGMPPADNTGFSQIPSPSTTSFSPIRYFTSNRDDYCLFMQLILSSKAIL